MVNTNHTIERYDDWKPEFDERSGARIEYGSRGYRRHHASDPDGLVAPFERDGTAAPARTDDGAPVNRVDEPRAGLRVPMSRVAQAGHPGWGGHAGDQGAPER